MKKILSLFLCALLMISAFSAVALADGEDAYALDEEYYSRFKGQNIKLYVYNWGEYIADGADGSRDVIAWFEELTGIDVEYTTFDTNEGLYSKLQSGSAYYDIVIPSDYMVSRLAEQGMLEKLNYENIPNFEKYVDESFKNPGYDADQEYSIPYTWGTVGIIYNTKYIESVDSWSALWNEEYAGKILMFDNSRDSFAIALKSLGYSLNSENVDEITEAAELLHYDFYWLSHEIKNRTGKTYTEHLQEKRLSQAAFLLKNTGLSVEEVALAVGYENKSYFHRIFTERFDTTPRKYRTENNIK